MSHSCNAQPRTVGELVTALSALDPNLPVYESWNEGPGWFEVDDLVVWLGVHGPCSQADESDAIPVEQVERDILL